MLHLITPLYRFQNVEKIYESITNYPDVKWHMGKSASKPYTLPFEDDRVKVYDVNCSDGDPVAKRNFALSKVTKDGYFHLLDDDTLFHPNMYKLYKQMEELEYKGMVIGKQVEKNNKLRLKELPHPIYCHIDAGNVLCHYSAIDYILTTRDKNIHLAPDYNLWEKAYSFFKEAKMTEDVISTYNALK
jgi:hypothetical protein